MSDEMPKKSTNVELLLQALKELGGKMGIYNPQTQMPNLPMQGGMVNNAQQALQNRPQQVNSTVDQMAQ
jgi:hypothetical protein